MLDANDPQNSAPALDRRAFVGLSATAAFAGSTVAAALAAGEGFGKPHPPLVPENDPAIATGRPVIRYGTRALEAYYASPRDAGPTTPAVVIAMAIWGVDAQIRDTARRFAKEGYIAIVPDLYAGLGAPNGDGASDVRAFVPLAQKLSDDVVDADLAAAAAFVRGGAGGRPQKVGVVGFCMGGAIALRQAVDNVGTFQSAAVFYGKVRYGTTGNNGAITPIALDYADEIGLPLSGSWGGKDTSILAADVLALDAKLAALKKPHDLHVYDEAGHAFFDDTRASYVADPASDAWSRTLAWFGRYLH
jgi:carboxymethylenebutenolidase